MRKYFILALLIFGCKSSDLNRDNEQYIIKTSIINNFGESEESFAYFYLNSADIAQIESVLLKKKMNINDFNKNIVENHKGIAIFNYPVKYWKASCYSRKITFPTSNINDTIDENKIIKLLKTSNKFKKITFNSTGIYKINYYFAKVKEIDFCKIKSDITYSDSCVVLKKLKL